MKRTFYILIFFSLSRQVLGQTNLVPNFSFETYTACPTSVSYISYADQWFNPTLHSPDYFNSCSTSTDYSVSSNYFGNQTPRTGNAYAGIGTACYNGSREYISIKLIDSLVANKTYYVEFFASLGDSCNYAGDDIGIYFSKIQINTSTIDSLNFTPQVKNAKGSFITNKNNWTKVSGYFKSVNYEKYMILGNFQGAKSTDSIFVANGGLITNPNNSGAYYYIDDVSVIDSVLYSGISETSLNREIKIFPNPVNSILQVNLTNNKACAFWLANSFGQIISNDSFIGNTKINISNLAEGLYFLTIIVDDKIYSDKIVVRH